MALDWDLCCSVPLLVTVLAVVLATLLFKLHSGENKPPAQVPREEREQEEKDKEILEEPSEEDKIVEEKTTGQKDDSKRTNTEKVSVDDIGASEDLPQERGADNETEEAEACTVKERRLSSHSSQEGEDSKDEDFDLESDKILKISEPDDADDEDYAFKYCPGKLRGSEYEKMLTKEELEEEQRVQRDQLGAIFQMMEKKQETFGAMSEGDVKDQLKLYNM
uniref:Matrix-remodeling-associated protein 7 helical domain-containing protein n=1 Tax=Leptobrachium leishanense TaxID=445787 RepID=A0A8C5MN35_9ANUR